MIASALQLAADYRGALLSLIDQQIVSGHLSSISSGACSPADPGGYEPTLAVNPRDPRNIIIAWDAAIGAEGAAHYTVAYSRDGGRTFNRTLVAGTTACTGGPGTYANDVWAAFGSDGTAFLAMGPQNLPENEIELSARSADGGASWHSSVVAPDSSASTGLTDQPRVTADPAHPGRLYEALERFGPGLASNGDVLFARSDDNGSTWTPLRSIWNGVDAPMDPGSASPRTPNAVTPRVLPGGVLVITWAAMHNVNFTGGVTRPGGSVEDNEIEPNDIYSIRSTDGGITWSAPLLVAHARTSFPHDPDTGARVRALVWPVSTVGPTGTLYLAWHQIDGTRGSIVMSSSTDGGRSWGPPREIIQADYQIWQPTIAAAPNGELGMTYLGASADRPGDGQFSTTVRFTLSRDGGRTWIPPTTVAGPFDINRAIETGETTSVGDVDAIFSGHFMGDYYGLAPVPGGFVATYVLPRPLARYGNLDIFFTRILTPTTQPGCPLATGVLRGGGLGQVRLGMTRAQARRAYLHSSDRGQRYEEFFCLTPNGVRVGYASPKLLSALPAGERARIRGLVVWASTANRHYSLRGVRPGASVGLAIRRLHLAKPLHVGLNWWYFGPDGTSSALIKARDGVVQEIGIADSALTTGPRAELRFITSFN